MSKRLEDKVRHIQVFSPRKMPSRGPFTQRKVTSSGLVPLDLGVGDFWERNPNFVGCAA